ncbi:MAG: hypothetical protein P4M07_16885 [Xanthobacteraceae bacterium]|nr:hypothetical protein [Xanthobacteraceae bacterium]
MHKFLVAAVLGVALAAAPAALHAAPRCPEMRTASGECVNPALTQAGRAEALDLTQQKLSYTAPPRLPGTDGTLVAPDWNEFLTLFAFPRVGTVPTTSRRP